MQEARVTNTSSWKKLQDQFSLVKDETIIDLFNKDPDRFSKFSISWQDFLVDYSKNKISQETLGLLLSLVEEIDLKNSIKAMFNGEKINFTDSPIINPKQISLNTPIANGSISR